MAKKYRGEVMIDYYIKYHLDRTHSAKECKRKLRRIQNDIRRSLSDGALNSREGMSKLYEQDAEVVEAMKCFKSEEEKEEYDKRLKKAYKANTVNLEATVLSQELLDEILTLFYKHMYQQVVEKCMEAIENDVYDVRLYHYMASSYRRLGRSKEALKTVEDGLKLDAENIELMKIGSRVYGDDYGKYDEAQAMIHRMYEVEGATGEATAEQIHLYMNFDKKEVAYQTLDDYIEKNPDDMQFRQQCAYDFIGKANESFVQVDDGEGGSYSVIIEEEAYEKCLEYCQKAVCTYYDENTEKALKEAEHFGEIEFNRDNIIHICSTGLSAALYVLMGISSVIFAFLIPSVLPIALMWCILTLFFGWKYIRATKGLYEVSKRPYWQIYKYYLTGEREPLEEKYIKLGRRMTWVWKFSGKSAFKIIEFIFDMMFRW